MKLDLFHSFAMMLPPKKINVCKPWSILLFSRYLVKLNQIALLLTTAL